jgi:hypothetical protein
MNKQLKVSRLFSKIALFFSAMLMTVVSLAQDKQVDVNISTNKSNNFWGSPWVWVIGAAVFILLLVAILRGGSRKDA